MTAMLAAQTVPMPTRLTLERCCSDSQNRSLSPDKIPTAEAKRRVIFPSLYRSSSAPASAMAWKEVENDSNGSTLPTLSAEEQAKLRLRLDHLLPLSPIREEPSVPATKVPPLHTPRRPTASKRPLRPLQPLPPFVPRERVHSAEEGLTPMVRKELRAVPMLSLNRIIVPSMEDKTQMKSARVSNPKHHPVVSILRSSATKSTSILDPVASISSDIPSLASSTSTESMISEEEVHVSFDPRVWVREFERSKEECARIWYTAQDMEAFRIEAVKVIQEYSTQLIPTGTGRMVRRPVAPQKLLFTHEALCGGQDEPTPKKPVGYDEIRKILLVDPHDICLKLLSKALLLLLPNVSITTATSSDEALKHLASKGPFDVVVVEERLKLFHRQHRDGGATERQGRLYSKAAPDHDASGSVLLRKLVTAPSSAPLPLYIGISAHLQQDGPRLKEHGADLLWSKPPPTMNQALLANLVDALRHKRGKAA